MGKLSTTSPCAAPQRAGLSPHKSFDSALKDYSKKAPSISTGFASALFVRPTRYRCAVRIESLVRFVGARADTRHNKRFIARIAELVVAARRQMRVVAKVIALRLCETFHQINGEHGQTC
jgi:hypothetical protein